MFRSHSLTPLAALAIFSLPLTAQGSALVIKTARDEIAYGVMDRFGSGGDLPELEAGQVWKIMLDDGGSAIAGTSTDKVPLLSIEAQPARLMEMFSAQVGRAQGMAQGFASMGLGQAGIKTKDAVEMMRTVFAFPKQIAKLTVAIDGDPDRPEYGWDIKIGMAPQADTWLAEVLAGAKSTGKGAPKIDSPSAAMQMVFDCDMQALGGVLDGFTEFMAKFGTKSDGDSAPRVAAMRSYWQAIGNGMAMNWDLTGGGGMEMLATLHDADKMRAVMTSKDYQEWMKAMSGMMPGAEVELTPNALSHRGVDVMRSVVNMEDVAGPQNPLLLEEMVTHVGIAGNFLVSMTGGAEADVKSLLDRALDQQIEMVKLPSNVIGIIKMRMAEFLDTMSQGQVPAGEMPELIEISIANPGNLLQLHIVAK